VEKAGIGEIWTPFLVDMDGETFCDFFYLSYSREKFFEPFFNEYGSKNFF
jgi:hypothetical protein